MCVCFHFVFLREKLAKQLICILDNLNLSELYAGARRALPNRCGASLVRARIFFISDTPNFRLFGVALRKFSSSLKS